MGDLIFAGFNRRVIAVDRYTGEITWMWKAPKGSGFVSLLLDGDRLLAGVGGYLYCLDPLYGQEVWSNPLKGLGQGVMSLASVHGKSVGGDVAAAAEEQRRRAAAAATAGGGAAAGAAAG
jgi:outer membrane protein assembly factor BamB